MDAKKSLLEAYALGSKHSQYQAVPKCLKGILGGENMNIKSRREAERLAYILDKIRIKGKTVIDIGGNTGFFSLELLDAGAKSVVYYEGNRAHADFVKAAAGYLKLGDELRVVNEYMAFEKPVAAHADIMLLLNVLHHVGDDYGDRNLTIDAAKELIIRQLNGLSKSAGMLVFQLGFNWKGDVKRCLFPNGTKKEMIDFIKQGTRGSWEVLHTGVAERLGAGIIYRDLDKNNIKRDDSLGEFLNRPLFIMKPAAAV